MATGGNTATAHHNENPESNALFNFLIGDKDIKLFILGLCCTMQTTFVFVLQGTIAFTVGHSLLVCCDADTVTIILSSSHYDVCRVNNKSIYPIE